MGKSLYRENFADSLRNIYSAVLIEEINELEIKIRKLKS